MKFGEALEACKQGKNIARKGWNGKDQFVFLIPAEELQRGLNYGYGEYLGEPMITGTLAIKTSSNQIQIGWLATQSDMLSDDWYVLGSKNMYRRKPSNVEALQWLGKLDEEMYKFLSNRNIKSYEEILSSGNYFEVVENGNGLRVRTKNGFVDVSMGDYIIKGENEYYPCNHETFERLYEKAYE